MLIINNKRLTQLIISNVRRKLENWKLCSIWDCLPALLVHLRVSLSPNAIAPPAEVQPIHTSTPWFGGTTGLWKVGGDKSPNICLTCIPACPQVPGIQMWNDNASSEKLRGLRFGVTGCLTINVICLGRKELNDFVFVLNISPSFSSSVSAYDPNW
jgi:hypothetical protein